MSYHRLPTAPLAARHGGAGSGAADNRTPQGATDLRGKSVQSNGATSLDVPEIQKAHPKPKLLGLSVSRTSQSAIHSAIYREDYRPKFRENPKKRRLQTGINYGNPRPSCIRNYNASSFPCRSR